MEEDQTPDVEHARTRVLKRFHVAPSKRLGALTLSVLAVAIGVVAGLGAFAFRGLIGLCHNLRQQPAHAARPVGHLGHD
jgi:hypothetical protein